MRIDLIKGLIVYQLSTNRLDRRGPICDLILKDIQNERHSIDVAMRIVQRICSLLDDGYFWNDNRDRGVSGFSEQFECWISSEDDAGVVSVRHKYWDDSKIETFIGTMLLLARLHKWDVDDRRKEDSEFSKVVNVVAKKYSNLIGTHDEGGSLYAEYMERAKIENSSPWRLLALDLAEGFPEFGPELEGMDQIQPGVYVMRDK